MNDYLFADIKGIDRRQWSRLLQIDETAAGAEEAGDGADNAAEAATGGAELERRLLAAEQKLLASMIPKFTFRILPKSQLDMEGFSIQKHLEECEKVAVMGVTLGSGVDRLIMTSEIRDVSEAFLLDTGASVLAEQVADLGEKAMMEILSRTDGPIYSTGRFSPGYGDYPLEKQRHILALIDGQRRLGITVSEGGIMIPRKSITAVSGLSHRPVSGRPATCDECLLKSKCTLIASGRKCYD